MNKRLASDFYEIQRQQWRKSLFLLLMLVLFYFLAICIISFIFLLSFGFFPGREKFLSGSFLTQLLLANVAISIIIASFHLFEARMFGARFILKRLDAQPPDPLDRYHKRFVDTVEEIRIASGLPKVIPHIMPSFASNAMAVTSADKTPNVIITEGMLAELTRDELEAVVSHEIAHISHGDSFYLTLVCSLANFFERLRQALEPEKPTQEGASSAEGGPTSPLLYLAVSFSSVIMHLLSTLISREREILADATAVEFSRNPSALARALYKAHLKNSFVGDFNLTYTPLFIVDPEPSSEAEGFFADLLNTHPPLMKRVRLLADMANTTPAKIIEEVWEIQKRREEARTILHSREETGQEIPAPAAEAKDITPEQGKIWSIRDSEGNWQGPYSLQELLFVRSFSPLIRVRNLPEGVEAQAREFLQVRNALRNLGKKKPIDLSRQNKCPRCHLPLSEGYYEGVAIKFCGQCGGKLVDATAMGRIITRKEVAFSEQLAKKASEFKQKFLLNPIGTTKINPQEEGSIFCPNCGSRMLPRPYNYQYFVPVDKCLSCYKIWFDADELEILQLLIEKR
jgi:Zn-dependent protease with chaperone function/Zn-finger nucleic acid-binding protein